MMTENQTGNENPMEETEFNDPSVEVDIEENEVVDDYIQEIYSLRGELEKAQAQSEEYLEGWQRARADFANYKKRIEREQKDIYQIAAASIIKRYLEVLDDLELALANRPESGEGAEFANGVELIYHKLQSILEKEGVYPMKAEGEEFDPNLHEAISSEESPEHESGEIIGVLKKGYMQNERVLRPALVRVAR